MNIVAGCCLFVVCFTVGVLKAELKMLSSLQHMFSVICITDMSFGKITCIVLHIIVAPVRQILKLGAGVRVPGAGTRSVRAPWPWCGIVVISKP